MQPIEIITFFNKVEGGFFALYRAGYLSLIMGNFWNLVTFGTIVSRIKRTLFGNKTKFFEE